MAFRRWPAHGTAAPALQGYAAEQNVTEMVQPLGIASRTAAEQYVYWSRLPPPPPVFQPTAPPSLAEWQGPSPVELPARAQNLVGIAGRHQPGAVSLNVQVMYVNDLHLHVYADPQHYTAAAATPGAATVHLAAAPLPSPDSFQQFHPNDPVFHPCYSPQGLDFGLKVVSRLYKAEKYVDPQYNIIVYAQCPSTAETFSHTVTLNLSHKRTKHAIFLMDESVVGDALGSSWPSSIHMSDIKSMIQKLGPRYEYHRNKVKNGRFSLYFYVIKRIGARFSERSQHIWSNLFRWAHAHQVSSDNNANMTGSNVTQVISQAASVGFAVISALV